MELVAWIALVIAGSIVIPNFLALLCNLLLKICRIPNFECHFGSLSPRNIADVRFKFSTAQIEISGRIESIGLRVFRGRKPLSLCVFGPSLQIVVKSPLSLPVQSKPTNHGLSRWFLFKLSQVLEASIERLSISFVVGDCEALLDNLNIAFRWDLRLFEFGVVGHSGGKTTGQISAEISGLQFRLQEMGCFRKEPLLKIQPTEIVLECKLSWLVPTEITTATLTAGEIVSTLDLDHDLRMLTKITEIVKSFQQMMPQPEEKLSDVYPLENGNSATKLVPRAVRVTMAKIEVVIVQDVCRTSFTVSQVFASCSSIFAFVGDFSPDRIDWSVTFRGPTIGITTSVRSLFHFSRKLACLDDEQMLESITLPFLDCEFAKLSGNFALGAVSQQLVRSLSLVVVAPRVFAHPLVSVALHHVLERVEPIQVLVGQLKLLLEKEKPAHEPDYFRARDSGEPTTTLHTLELSVVNAAISCYSNIANLGAKSKADFSSPICRLTLAEVQLKHDLILQSGKSTEQWVLSVSNVTSTLSPRPGISMLLDNHKHEHFTNPAQWFAMQSLKLHVGVGRYDIAVDGLFAKWSYLVMAAVPPIIQLVLLARPSRSAQAPVTVTTARPSPAPCVLTTRITNLRIDLPFQLELAEGNSNSDLCLFSYIGPRATAEADIATGKWALDLHEFTLKREDRSFMTCALLSLAGAPATQMKPELFDIKTRTCHAEWDPSLMLALFKAVKDVVVSVVNMKYDIHKSLRSVWPTSGKRMWCCKRPNKPLARRELRSLLSGKGTFVEQFLLWFKTTRDPWLPQPFMLITLDARDTIVRGTIAPYHLCIELDAFTSTFLPHQWSFLGCRIRYMDTPLLTVEEAEIHRVGVTASDVCSNFTEKDHLLMDYLDLGLTFRGVSCQLHPSLELGPQLEYLLPRIMGLVQAVWNDLPTLHELSLRHGGPGYQEPPAPPPPNTFLTLDNLSFMIPESPLEAWLQHLYPLWKEERVEQLRRDALLEVRLTTGVSTEQADEMRAALDAVNSRLYIQRLTSGLQRPPTSMMLELRIQSVKAEMSLDSPQGQLYSQRQMRSVMRALGLRHGNEEDPRTRRSELQESVHRLRAPHADPASRTNSSQDHIDQRNSVAGVEDSLLDDTEDTEDTAGMLAGRSMEVHVTDITVKLRNFSTPLLSMKSLALSGTCFLEGCEAATLAQQIPVGLMHTSEIQAQSLAALRILADLDIASEASALSFAPEYELALGDVQHVLRRCMPSFNFFVPVVDQRSSNLLHLARGCMGGRMGLTLSNTEVLLFPKATEPATYMTLCVASTLIRVDDGLLGVLAKEVTFSIPQSENHPHLLELPYIEIFANSQFTCREVPVTEESVGSVHVCGLQLSVSLMLPAKKKTASKAGEPPKKAAGLSLSVHSGSLVCLKKIAQIFATRPPRRRKQNGCPVAASSALVYDAMGTRWFVQETGFPNLEICGVYVERMMLEQVSVTVWEGADLGPARGLHVLFGTIYGSLELTNHENSRNWTSDAIYFELAKINPPPQKFNRAIGGIPLEILEEKSRGEELFYLVRVQPPRATGWYAKELLAEHPELVNRWQQAKQGIKATPPKQLWSISNVVAGLAKVELTIVENQKWKEAFDQARRHLSALSSSNCAVVHTYENQRWALRKWSKANLLPTDRPPWSNKEGTVAVPRNSCMLPDGWEWEGDWQLDHQLRPTGQEVDEEGWEYAMDFQRSWSGSLEWYSHVRRRRWIRIRRLKGTAEKGPHPKVGPQHSSSKVAVLERFELTQKRSHSVPNSWREMFREATRVTIDWGPKDHASSLATDITLSDFFRVEELFATKISERRAETEKKRPSASFPLAPAASLASRSRRRSITPEEPLELHSLQIESIRLVVNVEIRELVVVLLKQYTSIFHQDDSFPERLGKRRQDSGGKPEPRNSSLRRESTLSDVYLGSSPQRASSSRRVLPSPRIENPTEQAGDFAERPSSPRYSLRPVFSGGSGDGACEPMKDGESNQEAMFELRLRDIQMSIDAEDHGRIVAVVNEQVISGRIGAIEADDISPEPTQSGPENMDTPLEEDEEEDSQGQATISRLMVEPHQSNFAAPQSKLVDLEEGLEPLIEETDQENDDNDHHQRGEDVVDSKAPARRILVEMRLTAQMFVARSDVDVRVGRVWLTESTRGLFQTTMAPLHTTARLVWFLDRESAPPILTLNVPAVKMFVDSAQFSLITGVLASALAPLIPDTDNSLDAQLAQKSVPQLTKEAVQLGKLLNAAQWQLRCLQDILPTELPRSVDEEDEKTTGLSAEESVTWTERNRWPQTKLGQQVLQLTTACSEVSSRRAAIVFTLKSRSNSTLPSWPALLVFACKLQVDSCELDLMKSGAPFVSMVVQGIKISGSAGADKAVSFSLEIKSFGARKRGRKQEIEMITQCKLNEKDKSDSWTDASTTISLRAVMLFQQRPPHVLKALSHVDVNIFPLSFRISSDTVTAVMAFIYNEDAKRETHKFQKTFLPASHTLLEIELPKAFEIRPAAPELGKKSGGDVAAKAMGNLKEMFGKKERLSEDEADLDEAKSEEKQKMSFTTLFRRFWNANPQSENRGRFEVTHFRVGRTYFLLNYTGKKEHSNLEDIKGLRITLKGFLYQKKIWSGQQLLRRLRKDLIYGMLRQTGETLSEFLSYKLGLRKNDESDSEDEERYPHLPTSHEESRTLLFGERHR